MSACRWLAGWPGGRVCDLSACRTQALGLPWRAVDLDACRLEVIQTLVMIGGFPTLAPEAKTAHARRSIALDKVELGVTEMLTAGTHRSVAEASWSTG